MLDIEQFRQYILKPALSFLQIYSDDAEELLVFTCAAESDGGSLIHQVNGPALGIYQCEPDTHIDLWRNFIIFRTNFTMQLAMNFGVPKVPPVEKLMTDLMYATAIARLHYYRVKEKLPSRHDVDSMWEYYKQYYNTPAGKADKDKSIQKYRQFARLPAPEVKAPAKNKK